MKIRNRHCFLFRARGRRLDLGRRTAIMGVVNVTPDSFYDKGKHFESERAVQRCLQLAEEGADILDIGGESSRPGAEPVPVEEELARVLPVIAAVRQATACLISIDTSKADVAEAVLEAGGDIVNDISALSDPRMAEVVAGYEAGVVLMHMRGTPRTMQELPPSHDILGEIQTGFTGALETSYSRGIPHDRIMLDPGIGFGKTAEDNLRILNQLAVFDGFRLPILVGTSRKSFLGRIVGLPENGRLWATAASVAMAVSRGAHVVRVHDVKEIRMVTDVVDAILSESLEK